MSQAFQELLSQLGNGNRAALDEMMPVVYAEMRRLAEGYMRGERAGHTLQPTAVVHEAYLRLVGQQQVDWRNRAQVLGLAARMMRRVLLDHADRRNAAKRPDAQAAVTLSLVGAAAGPSLVDLIDLGANRPRWRRWGEGDMSLLPLAARTAHLTDRGRVQAACKGGRLKLWVQSTNNSRRK